MKPDMGIYYEMLDQIAATKPSLSYLLNLWPNADQWRNKTRSKVFELLAFDPPNVPLNSRVESREEDGLIREEISYDMPYGRGTHGFFLYPQESQRKFTPGREI